jgi:hypothetical protein
MTHITTVPGGILRVIETPAAVAGLIQISSHLIRATFDDSRSTNWTARVHYFA